MNDKPFVDSNIWIYLFGENQSKKEISLKLLDQDLVISTQVITENINVCFRKLKLLSEVVESHTKNLIQNCQVVLIVPETIELALSVSKRYQYSFYDSLIIAAALENNCPILYSEDMQHGQEIEDRLKILNPFFPNVLKNI